MSIESVLEHLGDVKITNKKELFAVLVKVMEIIEKYNEAETGAEKKELAINVLKELINHASIGEEDKALLIALVSDETVSDAIDVIIKVAKGDYELTKKELKRGIKSCLMSCLKKRNVD
jgi:hypothetical protein